MMCSVDQPKAKKAAKLVVFSRPRHQGKGQDTAKYIVNNTSTTRIVPLVLKSVICWKWYYSAINPLEHFIPPGDNSLPVSVQ